MRKLVGVTTCPIDGAARHQRKIIRATIASAKLFSCGSASRSPSARAEHRAQRLRNTPTSVTCSITSIASTRSKRSRTPSARRWCSDKSDRQLRLSACSFAAAMLVADGSTPITCAPSRVNGSHNRPAPQADIEDPQAGRQFRLLTLRSNLGRRRRDVGQPQRIDLVQRRHLAVGIPPFVRQFRNFATSEGSTVDAAAPGKPAGDFVGWPWLGRRPLSRGDEIAKLQRRSDVLMDSLPSRRRGWSRLP